MDSKTKEKQDKLIELVSSFCIDNLNEDYEQAAVKLVEKMGRKHDVPFKRGKLEIWASGVMYVLAQVNFLFNKSSSNYISADDICDYFKTKKSTVSQKANLIHGMFSSQVLYDEFSIVLRDDVIYDSMDDFFDEVYELFESGESEKALEQLDTIKKGHPEYTRALFYKFVILRELGDDSADDLFKQSILEEAKNNFDDDSQHLIESDDFEDYIMQLKDESSPEAFFNRGFEAYNRGDFEEALNNFNISVGLKPKQSIALYYKALSLARMEEFDEALEVIDEAIEINPNDDRFWNDKANFLSHLGSIDEALECFDRAIEINPKDPVIWANKGFILKEFERYDESLECYDETIKLNPLDIHGVIGKANVYLDMDDFSSARRYLRKASRLDSESDEYLSAMAFFMWGQDKFDEALHYWDKCLEVTDEPAMIWIHKAMIYSELNNVYCAEKCIEKAFEIDPFMVINLHDWINGDGDF